MHIRFFRKKEYAEQFLSGKLFCNSLNYFRTYPNCTLERKKLAEDKCTDLFEGSAQLLHEYFPCKELLEYICCDPHIVFSEYAKVHICCFSSVLDSLPKKMEQFGEWCVIINNFKIFEEKVRKAVNLQNKLYYLYGGVEYYEPTINQKRIKTSDNSIVLSVDGVRIFFDETNPKAFIKRDAFCKFSRFKSQKEYRLLFYRDDFTTDSYVISVEDLNDCCVLLPVSEADGKIKEYTRCNP